MFHHSYTPNLLRPRWLPSWPGASSQRTGFHSATCCAVLLLGSVALHFHFCSAMALPHIAATALIAAALRFPFRFDPCVTRHEQHVAVRKHSAAAFARGEWGCESDLAVAFVALTFCAVLAKFSHGVGLATAKCFAPSRSFPTMQSCVCLRVHRT